MENAQYQSQAPQPASEAAMPKTAMGITSLVLGVIAIVSSWVPIVNNLSALLALLGGVFGVVGVVSVIRGKKSGKALAIVGLALNVVALIVVLATQSMYSATIDDAVNGPAATSASASSESSSASETESTTSDTSAGFSNLPIGSAATLKNGVSVSVDSVETGLVNYDGSAITAVHVSFTNGSSQVQSFNRFDWKAQDAQGALRDSTYYSEAGDDELNYGDLAAGGTVTGVLYFDGEIVKANYYGSMLRDSATAAWTLS